MVPTTLSPKLDLLGEEYVLVQAWKKTAAYIRRHNWFSDTLDLDLTAVKVESFVRELAAESQQPLIWKDTPLRLVLAPKSQDWWVSPSSGDEAPHSWRPRSADPSHPVDVSDKLRPLAHVALRDQVVATALMLCLANRVETRQRDPRPAARQKERLPSGSIPYMSYGNRLFCDNEAGELRHRWGSTKLYRGYYQDYREFLAQTQKAAEQASGRQTFVVQADLSKFYDRVRPATLRAAVRSLQRAEDDESFFELADSVLDWEWHPDDHQAVERYAEAGDRPLLDFERVALPQGLVSAGFWANVALLDFDDALRTEDPGLPGLQLIYGSRYVDDLRLVLTTTRMEEGGWTPEYSEETVKNLVADWIEGILQDHAPGLELNQKTEAVEFEADRTGTVLQSRRMNRIQQRVSGGFTASEGLELLESIQGLLMIRSGFTRDADKSLWELAPKSEVPEDTRARFGAFRYRKVVRDIRAMLPAGADFGGRSIPAGPGSSIMTRSELDQMTRAFALVLIEKWVNDPSNVRILLIALDLWPDAELLEGVLSLLKPWTSSDMDLPDAQRVAWYCLSELFRAGATETGLGGDTESRPDGPELKEYRRLLIEHAWAVVNQAEPALPWYLRQQALLLLVTSESYSGRLDEMTHEADTEHYRKIAALLAGRPDGGDPEECAPYAIVLQRCFQKDPSRTGWTEQDLEAIARYDPTVAATLLRRHDGVLDGRWGDLPQHLLVDMEPFRPHSLARLVMDGEIARDEPTILRVAQRLIEMLERKSIDGALPPMAGHPGTRHSQTRRCRIRGLPVEVGQPQQPGTNRRPRPLEPTVVLRGRPMALPAGSLAALRLGTESGLHGQRGAEAPKTRSAVPLGVEFVATAEVRQLRRSVRLRRRLASDHGLAGALPVGAPVVAGQEGRQAH